MSLVDPQHDTLMLVPVVIVEAVRTNSRYDLFLRTRFRYSLHNRLNHLDIVFLRSHVVVGVDVAHIV